MQIPSPQLIPAIKARVEKFVRDNFKNPTYQDFLLVETAMLIGASVQTEVQIAQEREAIKKRLTQG